MKSNRRRRGEWLGGLVCGTFALAWVIAGSACIYIWVAGASGQRSEVRSQRSEAGLLLTADRWSLTSHFTSEAK